jgi:hypothetical protein
VERRREIRIETNQEVTVTVLGEQDSLPFQAVGVDMSGNGIRLLSPRPVPYQAAVKVEARDLLLLGEVIRVQVCDDGHILALQLQHSLGALGDLHRLGQALRWECQEVGRATAEELSV